MLYGIDPKRTFNWSPSQFRKSFLDREFERVYAWLESQEIKGEQERSLVFQREIVEKYRGRRVVEKGSPWIRIGPLPNELSLQLEAARTAYRRQINQANAVATSEITAIQKRNIPDRVKVREIKKLERQCVDANIVRGSRVYEPELVNDVLAAAVLGWGGFVVEFVDWDTSALVLPADWKYELFWDIVDGNSWVDTELLSFESEPGLQSV